MQNVNLKKIPYDVWGVTTIPFNSCVFQREFFPIRKISNGSIKMVFPPPCSHFSLIWDIL